MLLCDPFSFSTECTTTVSSAMRLLDLLLCFLGVLPTPAQGRRYFASFGNALATGIVQRLDIGTTGVMVVAKTAAPGALSALVLSYTLATIV